MSSTSRTRIRGCAARIIEVAILASACQSDSAPPNTAWHTVERLNIRFAAPDSFLVGRFAVEELPPDLIDQGARSPFRDAVVLVRPSDLGDHPLDQIPVGEIPAIWMDKSPTVAVTRGIVQPDTSYQVGELRVSRFPGYPGPYGDEAFYYVIELPDESTLEVAGHRRNWLVHPFVETHFDRVIEAILPTLEVWHPDDPPQDAGA